jgi:transposase
MGIAAYASEEEPTPLDVKRAPFAQVLVTLTKQAYTQLVWDARYWKKAHQRAIARAQQLEAQHRQALEQAALREASLRSDLEAAQARIRDLKKRVFGRKSEHCWHVGKAPGLKSSRLRGQQPGAPGHGRTMQAHLPAHIETIGADSAPCPSCGLDFADFPGTEDSEVLEIEVKAYRRLIRRRRYRKVCQCAGVPGIITAPSPARLIARGKYGISVWVQLLLSKFLYAQPTHRLLQDLSDSGLNLSAGTLTGGLRAIAPLFKPVEEALLSRLRSETHWHADETRWMVFIETEGKSGQRWYLWVFESKSAIHYVLDPRRSAAIPIAELAQTQGGILSCDRYSAYKKFARIHTTFLLAYCWAHQRRDFLELANDHPELFGWAFNWVNNIGQLYHLNALRLEARFDTVKYAGCDQLLRQAVEKMARNRDVALEEPSLKAPALKVVQSMKNHWSGLTVFVDHPEVPMDNNTAERALRGPVVGRKNFYGSGSQWSGQLAATMFSVLMTIKLWGVNPRTWLSAYLHACAANANQAPAEVSEFLPWAMDAQRLSSMRCAIAASDHANPRGMDSS